MGFARRVLAGTLVAMGAASLSAPARAQDEAPVVAAAASVQFAVEEIAARFAAETGTQVRLAIGSTGNFVRQIREGAPFEVFIAADEESVASLHADGFTRDAGVAYALGRLVIVAPSGSALSPDPALDNLAALLEAGGITRFAIANPEHAPYGARAREVLAARGIWDAVQPFLVVGENIGQATQFALSGNAEGGITAYSVVLAPEVAPIGTHALIPEDLHQPLSQRMALLKDAGPVAEAFFAFMQSPAAGEILERYGFVLPGD
jgi:molybdate transport system substrate-binding protein